MSSCSCQGNPLRLRQGIPKAQSQWNTYLRSGPRTPDPKAIHHLPSTRPRAGREAEGRRGSVRATENPCQAVPLPFSHLPLSHTWKWGLETQRATCLKRGSWIFTNWEGSMTSRISSISPRNITWGEGRAAAHIPLKYTPACLLEAEPSPLLSGL